MKLWNTATINSSENISNLVTKMTARCFMFCDCSTFSRSPWNWSSESSC